MNKVSFAVVFWIVIAPVYGQDRGVTIGEFWDALKKTQQIQLVPVKFSNCSLFDFESFQDVSDRPEGYSTAREVGRNEKGEVVRVTFHGKSKETTYTIDIYNFERFKIGRLRRGLSRNLLDKMMSDDHCINFLFKSKSIYMVYTCNYYSVWEDNSFLDISAIMRLNKYLWPQEIDRIMDGWPITHSNLTYSRTEGVLDVTEEMQIVRKAPETTKLQRDYVIGKGFTTNRGFTVTIHPVLPNDNIPLWWESGGFYESK